MSVSIELSIRVRVSWSLRGRPSILFSLLKWHGNHGKKANVGVQACIYKRRGRRRRSGAFSAEWERKIECTWMKRRSAPVIKHSFLAGTRAINLAKAKGPFCCCLIPWLHVRNAGIFPPFLLQLCKACWTLLASDRKRFCSSFCPWTVSMVGPFFHSWSFVFAIPQLQMWPMRRRHGPNTSSLFRVELREGNKHDFEVTAKGQ